MEKLGLSYVELAAVNPRLIYCEISGFGRTGPYAERGGFDLIAQGMSGLMSITGEGPGRPPVKVAAPISDINAGILGPKGRHLLVRGGDHPDLLAVSYCLCHR